MVGAGARLDLVETHLALGDSRPLTNLVNQVVLGRGAELATTACNSATLPAGPSARPIAGFRQTRV